MESSGNKDDILIRCSFIDFTRNVLLYDMMCNIAPSSITSSGAETAPVTQPTSSPSTKTTLAPTTQTTSPSATQPTSAQATKTTSAPATQTTSSPATKTTAAQATKATSAPTTQTTSPSATQPTSAQATQTTSAPATQTTSSPATKTTSAQATKTTSAPTTQTTSPSATQPTSAQATQTTSAPATQTTSSPATKTTSAQATQATSAPTTQTTTIPVTSTTTSAPEVTNTSSGTTTNHIEIAKTTSSSEITGTTTTLSTARSPTTTTTTTTSAGTTSASTTSANMTTTTTTAGTTISSCQISRGYCSDCGITNIQHADLRIVGGTAASDNEYPFMVSVLPRVNGILYACGGSIIKNNWILTVAHCFFNSIGNQANETTVAYGSTHLLLATFKKALRYITHENYTHGITNPHDDIALVEVAVNLSFSGNLNIRPICIAEESDIPYGSKGVVTGWGHTQFNGEISVSLQEVVLDVINITECASKTIMPKDTSKIVCALTPSKDACQGDSGGPFVAEVCLNRWVQFGIVSYGEGCASPDKPGVYTKVSAYRDWIDTNTGSATAC